MPLKKRASGVLLHITCLPSSFGIGDLGPCSYKFVDLLSKTNQSYWSILPVNPTTLKFGNSPYQPDSAFAGNPLLISPDWLAENGYLARNDLVESSLAECGRVDYDLVLAIKKRMIEDAFESFQKSNIRKNDFERFCFDNSDWLEDYSLYKALGESSGDPWFSWPRLLRDRDENALSRKEEYLERNISLVKFAQFLFFQQWIYLKKYCNERKLKVIGDLPFYLSYESADLWVYSGIFKLDKSKKPMVVGGVPPDYFSSVGQLWGNPVYSWQVKNGVFEWWIRRIAHVLKLVDLVRLDHFRGFVASWQVPTSDKSAINGRWVRSLPDKFFGIIAECFPELPFIAEDLGVITPRVRGVIEKLVLPGMKVLLFAFSGSKGNPHLPGNYPVNSVVFTGTHDTNTARGWFVEETSLKQKKQLFELIDCRITEDEVSWGLIRVAQESKACLSIIPVQDVLSLGSDSRMNKPGMTSGNWEWRVSRDQLDSECFRRLAEVSEDAGRC